MLPAFRRSMITFFTQDHQRHATTLNTAGCPIPYLELPDRVDVIQAAVSRLGFGEPLGPRDFGIGPIHDVHSGEFLEYLQEAYGKTRSFFPKEAPAIPDTFPGRSGRH